MISFYDFYPFPCFYNERLPLTAFFTFPLLFPLLFQKNLIFLKFIPYFWQKAWGQKDIFMYNVYKNNNLQHRKESSVKNKDKRASFYVCVSTYYKIIAVSQIKRRILFSRHSLFRVCHTFGILSMACCGFSTVFEFPYCFQQKPYIIGNKDNLHMFVKETGL